MPTKKELLDGAKARTEIQVNALGGETVTIRKLLAAEVVDVQALNVGGQKSFVRTRKNEAKPGEAATFADPDEVEIEMNLTDTTRAQFRADVAAAAYGLSCDETWSREEVEALAPDAPQEIARAVRAFTGLGGEAELERFRLISRGAVDGGAAPDGDATRTAAG